MLDLKLCGNGNWLSTALRIYLQTLTDAGKKKTTWTLWNEGGECYVIGNKAGYTATLVACGWAGAAKKANCDGPTDKPTDGQSGL